jgi:flavorubredoxin
MLPGLAGFMHLLKGLKPKQRVTAAFGSYGWAGGAVKGIENVLEAAGLETSIQSLGIPHVPDDNGLKKCYEYGKIFAQKIKGR